MGTWGYRTFENDGALDWLGELIEGDDLAPIQAALAAAVENKGEYLEADECVAAVAAAEVVAALRGRPAPDLPELLEDWLADRANHDPRLRDTAVAAVTRVSKDSELRDLWAESDELKTWQREMKGLIARLRQEASLGLPTQEAGRKTRTARPRSNLREGEVIALAIGEGRKAILRVLFASKVWKDVEGMLVYPPEAEAASLDDLSKMRPLGIGFTAGLGDPCWGDRVRRLGTLPLTPEELQLPIYWSDDLYQRDQWLRHSSGIDAERFPGLGVSPIDAMVFHVRVYFGLERRHLEADIELLRHGNLKSKRYGATLGLGRLGRLAGAAAIPALREALAADEGYKVRRGAARALGRIGTGRDEVRVSLTQALDDPHPEVREAAAEALSWLSDDRLRL